MLSAVTTTTSNTTGRNQGIRRLTRRSLHDRLRRDRLAGPGQRSARHADSRTKARSPSTIRERVLVWITSQIGPCSDGRYLDVRGQIVGYNSTATQDPTPPNPLPIA